MPNFVCKILSDAFSSITIFFRSKIRHAFFLAISFSVNSPLSSIGIIIAENLKDYSIDLIEHQLAHAVKDPNGRAYNRTSFLKERKEMMQAWADYLDEIKGSN